ncbi:MAG: T9SS type A sorting domain-containing protein, partial [Legionellales bacterium]
YNNYKTNQGTLAKKTTTTLSLPFFEDFTQYGIYPDSNKWVDYEVYINNTMCASPPSWGVATFDDLDANGIPYDSFSNTNFRYADSLTSQPIDLSLDSAADSVYLSFFYQPQGNGFYPLPQDSLMLFMKTRYGGFVKVWSTPGSALQPFQQVMIPITDSLYFHNAFQFRFVNIAALYWADAVWNIDYIRLDKNRNAGDTAINDVAFTSNPTFLLNDYSFMPYSQYKASPLSETVSQVSDSIRNNSSLYQSVTYLFSTHDVASGTALFSAGAVPLSLAGYQTSQTPEAFSIPTLPVYPTNTKVVFENKFYLQSTSTTGPTNNDTIVKEQVFDNYLAYDDGTAEKSYYLNLFPTLPGKIAIEFHLNIPDTLRGMAIYFGRQIPFGSSKTFSINVYSALTGVNGAGADINLYTSDLLIPEYADTTNHFWYYTFPSPLVLPAGTFYAGTTQCADCGSDSLYFGLDVNRIGSNHAYYNVLGVWNPSLISGAIMMRPLLGKYIPGTGVTDIAAKKSKWQVMPNPAKDYLQFEFEGQERATYHITDITGHTLLSGMTSSGKTVDLSRLAPGMYFVNLVSGSISRAPQKIIKL